ncbi:2-oxoglutarate dehydrogenase E1 component [Candidatus Deianiraea vastatrix]|uniref:2-oxoglutarate dehydrogenase E1 component n=1 Tax=Candidatus Deianiraea vastatrix TaxID=2163644 RepID=A0A5B8XF33_9RICK|nr:2-oxoglutarate dehydrogenase E1 component [Candidatus Deianiraea vastatrix]QED23902.1 2-oxoglutarate dehydrogenase E1 component [Candidatus Deianiraea vastatrix]
MSSNDIFNQTQFLYAQNAAFIADLYKQYTANSNSVDENWRNFFASMSKDEIAAFETDFFGPSWKKRDLKVISKDEEASPKNDAQSKTQSTQKQDVACNISAFREKLIAFAHISADYNPIIPNSNRLHPEISQLLPQNQTHEGDRLKSIYLGSVGAEFSHISNLEEKNWIVSNFEALMQENLANDRQKSALEIMIKAETFEQFIHKKFPGMKRFSVEGGETSLAIINEIIYNAAKDKVKSIIIGMAHRGRLGMLTNIAEKPASTIFSEFLKTVKVDQSLGEIASDVKYHAGHKTTKNIEENEIDVEIAYNPSHLEAVNPLIIGMAYAKNKDKKATIPLLIHGDAAMIGQGIVAECFNMSGVKNYDVGGTIHLTINNQIGFTAESWQSRSSRYCTDIAKIIECPIFHVNGDDVDACVKIAKFAVQYRQKFKKDIVIDLVCSRKYGHNEGDEPFYTNPMLYNVLKDKKSPPTVYFENLLKNGNIAGDFAQKVQDEYLKKLDKDYEIGASGTKITKDEKYKDFDYKFSFQKHKTGIKKLDILPLLQKIYAIPSNFTPNSRLAKQIETRLENIMKTGELDWAAGEILAFASLVLEGKSVRITGQDSERGTFSHRHSVLTDATSGGKHNILSILSSEKASYEVCNSPLSEYAIMGFEYGYSLVQNNHLTIWEGQFGDFANGASTIFDQFISSAEQKWLLMSNLVLLLPHGFEGQGPEHSSARLERYLQACAQENIIVANPTTPANLFHILRRQLHAKFRKPLIIMSPKSLLRHKMAVSKLDEFEGEFMPIISEIRYINAKKVEKVVVTSGKLYYDLLERAGDRNDVAIIRIEQYYPFDSKAFEVEISQYKSAKMMIWAQEEPRNMGAWQFIRDYLESALENSMPKAKLSCVSRPASASPATGFEKQHQKEQAHILEDVLG